MGKTRKMFHGGFLNRFINIKREARKIKKEISQNKKIKNWEQVLYLRSKLQELSSLQKSSKKTKKRHSRHSSQKLD